MKVMVNGDWREIDPSSIEAVLDSLGYANAVVATALNGEFIPKNMRGATALVDGDHLEVIAPMQGG